MNEEYTVPNHGLSREVGIVCSVPGGRTISKSQMLQVFLQTGGSVGDQVHPQGFGANSFLV